MRIFLKQIAFVLLGIQGVANTHAQQPVLEFLQVVAEAGGGEEDQGENDAPEILRPLINDELSFVFRACEPTDKQMKAIVAAAKEAHKAMASIVTERGRRVVVRNTGVIFLGPNHEQLAVNPYQRVREDFAKLLQPIITADQYARYVKEAKLREAYEREAAISIVLNMIDARLILTEEQRSQLFQKLLAEWEDAEFQWLQNYRRNPQYVPQLPNDMITPFLTPDQSQRWTEATSQRVMIHARIDQRKSSGFTEEWLK